MTRFLLFLPFLFLTSLLSAQSTHAFGIEFSATADWSQLQDPNDRADSYYGGGAAVNGTYDRRLTDFLRLRTGLGIGYVRTRQVLRNELRFGNGTTEDVYLSSTQVYAAVPVSLIVQPLAKVPVYLRGGLRYRLNSGANINANTTRPRIFESDLSAETALPGREADFARETIAWEAGLAFCRWDKATMRGGYLELTTSRTLGNYVNRVDNGPNSNRNYLGDAQLLTVTLTIGRHF